MDTLVLIAHYVCVEEPVEYNYLLHGVSWSIIAASFFLFSFVWWKSFIRRKVCRPWETSLVLCIVFMMFGIDKIFDVLSIWFNLEYINTLLEGSSALLFVTWVVSHFKTKQLPVFLSYKDIDEIDIKQHEKKYHSFRITNMLKTRNDDDISNEN